jgi:hypothetical protein
VAHQTTSGITNTTTYYVGSLKEVDGASGAVTKYYATTTPVTTTTRIWPGAVPIAHRGGLSDGGPLRSASYRRWIEKRKGKDSPHDLPHLPPGGPGSGRRLVPTLRLPASAAGVYATRTRAVGGVYGTRARAAGSLRRVVAPAAVGSRPVDGTRHIGWPGRTAGGWTSAR